MSGPDLLAEPPFHAARWPRTIVEPAQFGGGDALAICWDVGSGGTEADKQRTIRAWCTRLPDMQQLERLQLWVQVTPPVFEAACRIHGLRALQLKWSNLTKLDGLTSLVELRHLAIGSSTRVQSIEPLAALPSLQFLEIENFKLVSDFAPLVRLRQLQVLQVTGSMWSRQEVASLEPFAQMTWLRALAVDTTNVESLRPLAALVQLEELGLGGKRPMEEYAWLAAKLPRTRCRWFQPFLDLAGSGLGRCKACGNESQVMPTGRGTKLMCRVCDAAKLQRHVDAFEALKAAAAD